MRHVVAETSTYILTVELIGDEWEWEVRLDGGPGPEQVRCGKSWKRSVAEKWCWVELRDLLDERQGSFTFGNS
jgi:hypothetical protein